MPTQNDRNAAYQFTLSASPYSSRVLRALDEDELPAPLPACATCPAAMWYHTSQALKCSCSVMHILTWGGSEGPVMICDAREIEIAALRRHADERKARQS